MREPTNADKPCGSCSHAREFHNAPEQQYKHHHYARGGCTWCRMKRIPYEQVCQAFSEVRTHAGVA